MSQTSTATHSASSSDLKKLAELIKDIRVAMLVTLSNDGDGVAAAALGHTLSGIRARPMYTQAVDPETFDGELLFLTDADCDKVRDIRSDQHILITFAGSGNKYISITGTAAVDHDVAMIKAIWGVHAQGWWPGGPEDPKVTLLRVQIHAAEYWDGPSTTRYMLSLAKAVITKQRIEADSEHAEMRLA